MRDAHLNRVDLTRTQRRRLHKRFRLNRKEEVRDSLREVKSTVTKKEEEKNDA